MKKLRLNRGYAIVDDDIYMIASHYRWYVNTINHREYVVRNERVNDFKQNKILLHRFVYEFYHGNLRSGIRLTFVNGNTLDCRNSNIKLERSRVTVK